MSRGHGVSGYTHTQAQLDHYANQHNPNNHEYWDDLDNHANQLNPNNDLYDICFDFDYDNEDDED